MRLACPNCDARYEVPDDAIPAGGRDVQCSNCGHAWFQLRPEDEIAAVETEVAAASAAFAGLPGDGPAEGGPDDDAAAGMAPDDGEEAAPSPAAPPPAAPPRAAALEDSVLSVLREEAEREAEARKHEAQRSATRRAEAEEQMRVQPDLGIGAPAAPTAPALSPVQRRVAMLKGKDPDAAPPEPPRPTARRDLLPDVEEINSTLQPGDTRHDLDAEVDALPDLTARRSFRIGFLLALLVIVAAAVVYVAADSIAALVPALKGPLDSYVALIDGLRLWLNGAMDNATNALNGPEG